MKSCWIEDGAKDINSQMEQAGIGGIAAIIIGWIAGWLAEKFMRSDMGVIMNIVIGIVGAIVANTILSVFGGAWRLAGLPHCRLHWRLYTYRDRASVST